MISSRHSKSQKVYEISLVDFVFVNVAYPIVDRQLALVIYQKVFCIADEKLFREVTVNLCLVR